MLSKSKTHIPDHLLVRHAADRIKELGSAGSWIFGRAAAHELGSFSRVLLVLRASYVFVFADEVGACGMEKRVWERGEGGVSKWSARLRRVISVIRFLRATPRKLGV